ncbi:tetratricopeptide repeat protein [Phaeacidiphilus oryzae]
MSVRTRGSLGSTSRGRLGAGLVHVEPVAETDPRSMVQPNPEVPERKRFCSKCEAPVGRGREGRPGRTEGFCTKCGTAYSFSPKLFPGDLVDGQYEVIGALAHGGLGWIYLAIDQHVENRPVVLKGLLNTGDEEAIRVAIAERRYLAEVDHPNLVRIIDFAEHPDATRPGQTEGYIVMEYVGGKSLKDIANERRLPDGRRDPLPVEQAIAYALEVLPALGYLHDRGLIYCDFKLDNVIQSGDRLKIIDLGAVRHADDEGPIFGTIGYQAPEIATEGVSPSSDLYTVARTLAVLSFDFQGYTTVYRDTLPGPEAVEVFNRYESFYRLLVRGTDPDPSRRFSSAEEMAEQLTGVLREILSLKDGRPRPALSTLFGTELRVVDNTLVARREPGGTFGEREIPPAMGSEWLASFTPRGRARARERERALTEGAAAATSAGATGALEAAAAASNGAAGTASIPAQQAGSPNGGASPAIGATPAAVALPAAAAVPSAPADPAPLGAGRAPGAPEITRLDPRQAGLALPVPRIDAGDPNAGFLAALVATAPGEVIAALQAAPAPSVELRLRELRARIELGETDAVRDGLAELEQDFAADWRVVWYRGLASLVAAGDAAAQDPASAEALLSAAADDFDALYDAFPGEAAPKLALGVCAELLGEREDAAEFYRLVWTTDTAYVSAAFGLARVLLASNDRAAAVRALESVPETSIHYTASRIAAIRARIRERAPEEALRADLAACSRQLADLPLDARTRTELTVEVLDAALGWVLAGRPADTGGAPTGASGSVAGGSGGADGQLTLLGHRAEERELRFALEHSYRVLARLSGRREKRIEWVERANRTRPRTWV